jgi:hypothetical protein
MADNFSMTTPKAYCLKKQKARRSDSIESSFIFHVCSVSSAIAESSEEFKHSVVRKTSLLAAAAGRVGLSPPEPFPNLNKTPKDQ